MKKFQEMHIPCTEQQYPEVKSLLERMGCKEYSDNGVKGCQRVFVYDDGDFQSLNHFNDMGFPIFTLNELRLKASPKVSDTTMSMEDRIKRIEIHLGLVAPDKPEDVELKDWCVSLTHETLSKAEVVSRCFAAALAKGYERTENKVFLTLRQHAINFGKGNARMFSTSMPLSNKCGIVHASGHEEITLEGFEAYCGAWPE